MGRIRWQIFKIYEKWKEQKNINRKLVQVKFCEIFVQVCREYVFLILNSIEVLICKCINIANRKNINRLSICLKPIMARNDL